MSNELPKFDPWKTIWFNARATIRQIIENDPNRSLLLLLAFGGLSNALHFAADFGMADRMPFTDVLVLSLVAGPLSGFIGVYLWSWLLGFSTRFFGGVATRWQMRRAIAWSWAPAVSLLPLWIVKYIMFRQEIFKSEKPFIEAHPFLSGLYGVLNAIDFFISILAILILFNTVAEVNDFSIWKSMGAIGVVLIVLTLPAILVVRFLAPI